MKSVPPLPIEDLEHILRHTITLWEEARGKSFFITGGTGFFGMWLLESFIHCNDSLNLGATATVLSRDPSAFSEKAPHLARRSDLTFIKGDIRDFQFPKQKYDYLLHAATEASAKLNREAPYEMLDSIIAGMRRVLDFSKSAKVNKFLFTSSGAVYGQQPSDLTHVPEDHYGSPDCLSPSSAYGEGKRVAELMAAIHSGLHGTEVKIARCFAFVGPHLPLDGEFAIGNFLRDAMAGDDISIKGDGTPHRSYLYAADLAIWLWTILFKGESLRPYNVGSEENHSISQFAAIVNQSLGTDSPIEIARPANTTNSVLRYAPSTLRARNELGLAPMISLENAIKRTAFWHRHSKCGLGESDSTQTTPEQNAPSQRIDENP
ncbi:MAG: hypothetical protein RLZZ505_367 [Verrucomicrobiota bacterium]